MKVWWNQLQARERRLVVIGGLCFSLLMIWLILVSPLYQAAKSSHADFIDKKQLLSWMQPRVEQIKQLKLKTSSNSSVSSEDMLTLIEKNLKADDSGLAEVPHQLSLKDKNGVTLNFARVDYANLMTWLTTLAKTQSIKPDEVSLKRLDKVGVVSASVVLVR